jgi:hypothetical protein
MKRILIILGLVLFCSTSFAGITYKVQSTTTGVRNVTIAGKVSVDGPNMRMDVTSGDDLLFKANSVVLSHDGGKTMTVLDGSNRSYYQLQFEQVLDNSVGSLKSMNETIKIAFNNPRVSVRDAGKGGMLEGYPTRRFVLDASYDVAVDAMGQKMTTHISMTTESWTTDRLSSEFANFLQMKGFRTGMEALDKLIAAQTTAVKGFPLKQVSTVRMKQGRSDMIMVTTATVSNIEKKAIDASQFSVPAGYTKVDDPITKMVAQIKTK